MKTHKNIIRTLIMSTLMLKGLLVADPIASYPFNGVTTDASGNGNNGTVSGFDLSNLRKMRQFYSLFPYLDALRLDLSWTHSKHIFASKYKLVLPTEEELDRELKTEFAIIKSNIENEK